MKNLEIERLFDYFTWFASLTEEQKKEEIKKIDLEDKKRGNNPAFMKFALNFRVEH